nr:restriction endonuclease [Cupriavidus sp. L7L]
MSPRSPGESAGRREDVGPPSQTAPVPEKPEINSWTLDALKQLEWTRFEMLCVGYYEAMGFTVKTVPHGPDGGIDAT